MRKPLLSRRQRLPVLALGVAALHLWLLLLWQAGPGRPLAALATRHKLPAVLQFQMLAQPPRNQAALPPASPVPLAQRAAPAVQPKPPAAAQQEAAVPQATVAAMAPLALQTREGLTVLDFQLASIQGLQVQLGDMTLSLEVQGGRYASQSRWSLGGGEAASTSQGTLAGGLIPASYQAEGAARLEAVDAMAQDPLSIIWSLRERVAVALQPSATAREREWPVWLQTAAATQPMLWKLVQVDAQLVLPGGDFRAAKVVGTRDGEMQGSTSIWYALDFDYLPVRIEITDAKGRVQDAQLRSHVTTDVHQILALQ